MLRGLALSLVLAASACAPAPPNMPATQAIELLERFAAGSARLDVCSPRGRAMLRGAVRSYGQEMHSAGVDWPALPQDRSLNAVDATVVMSMVAGFIEPSDLHGGARALAGQFVFASVPQVRDFQSAARVACAELIQLQQGAVRYVVERQRLEHLVARNSSAASAREAQRIQRQSERLDNTLADIRALAERVEQRVAESRRAG